MTGGDSWLLPVDIGAGEDSDAEELEMLAVRLRAELLELDVDGVQRAPAEPGPPGAKGPAGDSVSTLLITFSNSATAVALIGLFRSWIKRNRGRSITIHLGRDKIEASNVSAEELSKLIETWMKTHGRK
jgi:hypothetical protein